MMYKDYQNRVSDAVRHFWEVRTKQQQKQGASTGKKDAGLRSAVTGGKHLDGFISLLSELITAAGMPSSQIHTKPATTTLPGYFRPTKKWDLIVVADGQLLASIEFKAQVGPSFGNNFNNRVEEAVGNSVDLLTAYRDGKFKPSHRPWLGWLMLLEDAEKSIAPVKAKETHFPVFPEFKDCSYAKRYELFCEKLVRERMYDSACLLMTTRTRGLEGEYSEPSPECNFRAFAISLIAHVQAYVQMR